MKLINRVSIRRGVVCRGFTATLIFCSALLAGSSPLQAAKAPEPAKQDRVPEGISASDWQSIRAAHEAWKHAVEPVKGGWQARNPAQQWTTKFDGRGFEAKPQHTDWTWGLELRSYGAGDEQREVNGTPEVKTDGHRLAYHWDETVQEWYVNDGRGLEHGFSVQERPPGPSDAPLTFVLATRGSLRAAVTGDARAVDYRDKSGATVLTYSGLRVWDADGRELEARFAPAKDGVTLQVDAKDARYPLLIDPIAQQAYLKRFMVQSHRFGITTAVSGDTMVVGDLSGRVHVFTRNSGVWTRQTILRASNDDNTDGFGLSLALSGDTLVVGAPNEDSNGSGGEGDNSATDAGAVYVFTRTMGVWTQQAYLKAPNTGAGDSFGFSVAISGDTLVAGAYGEDGDGAATDNNNASGAGAAYIFVRDNMGVWTPQAYLKASITDPDDNLGSSVAISGDTVVVGAPGEDGNGFGDPANNSITDAGAVYVFVRDNMGVWAQQDYLKSASPFSTGRLGKSVAISSDTLVAGAPGTSGGSAFVFVRSGMQWTEQTSLAPANPGTLDSFGGSVAISGNTVVVGATAEDGNGTDPADNSATNAGAAYVFVRSGTMWNQQAYLKAWNADTLDGFGTAVAISGDTVVTGAPAEDGDESPVNNNDAPNSGAAYVFTGTGGTWSAQAYVKDLSIPNNTGFGQSVALDGNTLVAGLQQPGSPAEVCVFVRSASAWSVQGVLRASNGEGGDNFGGTAGSLAISGDTVVVGAPLEASSSTNPADNSLGGAGAAYVFIRDNMGFWSQQAYLKAPNPGSFDQFGRSVAISGNTLVVGAAYEDGNGTTPSDDSILDAGAAYVFTRSGTTWSQPEYIKAPSPAAEVIFASSVAISGDTLAVGAPNEDGNGVAHIFTRSGMAWTPQTKLTASNAGLGDGFGSSVGISGDTLVVGAPYEDGNGTSPANDGASDAGAAYVFARNNEGVWSEQVYLKASNAGIGDYFGTLVAISGDTVAAGAPREDSNGTTTADESASNAGAAYVFARNLGVWSQQAYLKASNAGAEDRFGSSIGISGDTLVVGALQEDSNGSSQADNSASDSGAVYVFTGLGPAPVITSAATANGQVGVDFNYQITATAVAGVDSYDATGLPGGLSISASTGAITGKPTAAGTFSVTISATNGGGTGTGNLTLQIALPPAPVITSMTTATGQVGVAFTYQITTSGGTPTEYNATGLPAGFSINTGTGAITGTPSAMGMSTITLTASNAGGSDTETLTLDVSVPAAPVITSMTTANGQVGVDFNYQITTSGGTPTEYDATGLPAGLVINKTTGQITGKPGTNGMATVTLTAKNAGGMDTETLTLDIAAPPAVVIISPKTANGQVGVAFNYQIATSGGTPTSYNATGLPAGLSINATTGEITGTPTTAGMSTVTLWATDTFTTDTEDLTINILPAAPIITSATAKVGQVGMAFTYQITASGGMPTSYNATGLPAGLSINATTGEITGTPTAAGVSTVTLTASNTGGADTETLQISILPTPPVISSPTAASGQVGVAFTYQITSSGGVPYSYDASGLPSGLSINTFTGEITGRPTSTGTFSVALTAANINGSHTETLTLTIAPPPPPVITSVTSASGQVGTAFNYQITASGIGPISYNAIGLPAGLSINPTTGAISGAPAAASTSNVTLSATNAGGTDTETLTLAVAKAPQTITFKPTAVQKFKKGRKFTLSAGATSKLPVSFKSSNTKILSIKGKTATIRAKGKVTVTAVQGGNANYLPAKAVKRTITIK